MRHLHIVQRYRPAIGGSEWYMEKISEGLVNAGHNVDVLTTTALDVDSIWRGDRSHLIEGCETINGVEVRRIKPRYLPAHGKTMTLLSFLPGLDFKARFAMPGPLLPVVDELSRLSGDYDVVHAAALPFTSLLWSAWKLARGRNALLIFSPFMHFGIPDKLGYGYRKGYQVELLKKADRIIAQTVFERDGLARLGVDGAKIRVVGLGIEADALEGGDGERFLKKHNLSGPVVFNLSARTFDKGAIHVIDAMRKLWERGVDARLVMAGPRRDDYVAHVKKQPGHVRERIVELGIIDDREKADLFHGGDIFCMPSRAESFGIVYLESWICGAPVVAARVGATPEIVDDGVDGILTPFGDVDAIADALARLISDKQLRENMGRKGREKTRQKYQWRDKFNAYMGVLEEIT